MGAPEPVAYRPQVQSVVNNTRAAARNSAVCGYRGWIDWMESAAFDLMLLSKLGTLLRIDRPGLRMVKESMKESMKAICGDLHEHLGFRMVIKG